jgi:hypothetical protein
MSFEDRDWYRAEMKRRSRWFPRSRLGDRFTFRVCILLVAVAATLLADRAMDETHVVGEEMPNVIVPTGSVHAPQSRIIPSRAVRPTHNCTEARRMGLENIPRGSPYYAPWLDGDNDGLACEPLPRRG